MSKKHWFDRDSDGDDLISAILAFIFFGGPLAILISNESIWVIGVYCVLAVITLARALDDRG